MLWINLAQDKDRWRAVVKIKTDLSTSEKTGNFLTCLATICSSRWALLHGIIQLIGIKEFREKRK
jgi:hypothetical protein